MKKNMGLADRVIRTVLALVIAAAIYLGYLEGTLAILLAIIAVVFLVTSMFAFCPLYVLFKISTLKK